MPLHLPTNLADAIRAHAAQDYPHECCGFLVGTSHPATADLGMGGGITPSLYPTATPGPALVTVARTVPGRQHAAGTRRAIGLRLTPANWSGWTGRRGRTGWAWSASTIPTRTRPRGPRSSTGNTPGPATVTSLSRSMPGSPARCGTGSCATTAPNLTKTPSFEPSPSFGRGQGEGALPRRKHHAREDRRADPHAAVHHEP